MTDIKTTVIGFETDVAMLFVLFSIDCGLLGTGSSGLSTHLLFGADIHRASVLLYDLASLLLVKIVTWLLGVSS